MARFLQRLLDSVPPGVLVLLGLLGGCWGINTVGTLSHSFDFTGCLELSAGAVRGGELWRIFTHVLVPGTAANLIMNCLALAALGRVVERNSSRGQFWMVCASATAGAGLAHVAIYFSGSRILAGPAPLVFGLLAALGCLAGGEKIFVRVLGETTVRLLVLAAGGTSLLITAFSAGPGPATVLFTGGLSGGLYVWVIRRRFLQRAGSAVPSQRIHHLEL